MTLFIADIASYQGNLTPEALLAAKFTAVNVKISDGVGNTSVHPDAAYWLADSRFTRSTFHYLRPGISGKSQANYAYSRLRALCPSGPVAHVVDVEADGITATIFNEYVSTMVQLLGRPIAVYTGDWYAASRPWVTCSISAPWLWAAPNVGYLGAYPGDTSDQWYTGYASTTALSVMQYAVGKVGSINVSMSALRIPAVWDAMRGVTMAWQLTQGLQNLRAQVNARWPNRDKASDGTIGDTAHQAETSGHNPDDTAGSRAEWDGDSDSLAEVRAWDMDSDLGEAGTTAQMVVDHLRSLPNLSSLIRYMIYNRKIYRAANNWAEENYAGASAHTEHIHFSGQYSDAADSNTTYNFRFDEVGDMALSSDDLSKIQAMINGVPKATWAYDPGYVDPKDPSKGCWPGVSDATFGSGGNGTVAPGTAIGTLLSRLKSFSDRPMDYNAMAAALAPVLAQQLAPLLPTGTQIDQTAVTNAVYASFQYAFGAQK